MDRLDAIETAREILGGTGISDKFELLEIGIGILSSSISSTCCGYRLDVLIYSYYMLFRIQWRIVFRRTHVGDIN